jgi:hypothetical protein
MVPKSNDAIALALEECGATTVVAQAIYRAMLLAIQLDDQVGIV